MKKLLSVLLVLGAIAASAEDSYLYWMVGDGAPAYSSAKVKAFEGGDYLTILNAYGDEIGYSITTEQMSDNMASTFGLYAALGADPTYSSFVIELYNDSGFVGQSEITYSQALANNYITFDNSMVLPAMWAPTTFAIPEPNSALLMLLGCAVLGLRRRRQCKA